MSNSYDLECQSIYTLFNELRGDNFLKALSGWKKARGARPWVVGASSDYICAKIPRSQRGPSPRVRVDHGHPGNDSGYTFEDNGFFGTDGRDHVTILAGTSKADYLNIFVSKNNPELFDVYTENIRRSANGYYRGSSKVLVENGLNSREVADYVKNVLVEGFAIGKIERMISYEGWLDFRNWVKQKTPSKFYDVFECSDRKKMEKKRNDIDTLPPLSDSKLTAQFLLVKELVAYNVDKSAHNYLKEISAIANRFKRDFV